MDTFLPKSTISFEDVNGRNPMMARSALFSLGLEQMPEVAFKNSTSQRFGRYGAAAANLRSTQVAPLAPSRPGLPPEACLGGSASKLWTTSTELT